MFKPTQILHKGLRRLRLTTKQAPVKGGYYKGNRTGSMGWHTKHGGFIIDLRKVRTYIAPAEPNEELTPFVSKRAEKVKISKATKRAVQAGQTFEELEQQVDASQLNRIRDDIDSGYIGKIDGKRFLALCREQNAVDETISQGRDRLQSHKAAGMVLPGQQPSAMLRDAASFNIREREK